MNISMDLDYSHDVAEMQLTFVIDIREGSFCQYPELDLPNSRTGRVNS